MTSSPTKHEKPRKRMPLWGRILLGIGIALLAVAVLLCALYAVLYYQGKSALTQRGSTLSAPESLLDAAQDDLHQVTYKGTTYRYNEDVISILFMGVDKKDIGTDLGYGQNGQADSLFVAAIDIQNDVTRIIPISRESMVDVNVYGVGGAYAGVEKTQLCLAYAYGATGEESCENVLRSVRRLLYGVDINAYAALDLDGIAALTTTLGGVTVTAPETVDVPPLLHVDRGETVTLSGKDAATYIRYRGTDLNANNRRITRQKQFLTAFIHKLRGQIASNLTRVTDYYNVAEPYLVSDMDLSRLTYIASTSLDAAANLQYLSIKGETVMGDDYVEFYPDTVSTYEAVLEAFYTPIEPESEG